MEAGAPGDADGYNNSPRKEIAAYQLQAWFLDPPDYVVPTTALRCLPPEMLRKQGCRPEPNMPGAKCVLGVLSVWLDKVTVPEHVLEPEQFASDAQYAANLGRFNLLTYLVKHEDGRAGNILVSKTPEDRRVFAIDNGIAFDAIVKNWFVPNWNVLRVPAVPHLEIERLRRIERSSIDRLGVVAEMKADANGMLQAVPPSPNRDPDNGTRVSDGWVQLGLTEDELDGVEERLEELLERVDDGELPEFLSMAVPETNRAEVEQLRPSQPADSPALIALAEGTGVFKPIEIQALEEVLSDYHARERANGHRCVTAWRGEEPIGFVYWAPAAMTDRTWHLWWIAVRRDLQSRGSGTRLLACCEAEVRAAGGRLLLIETSSLAGL